MAVGARIIEVIKKDRLLDNAAVMGDKLKKGLEELVGKGGVMDVRGIGLMVGIEFDNKKRRDENLLRAFRKGLLLLPAGQKAMRFIPPLTITPEELDEGLQLMRQVVAS